MLLSNSKIIGLIEFQGDEIMICAQLYPQPSPSLGPTDTGGIYPPGKGPTSTSSSSNCPTNTGTAIIACLFAGQLIANNSQFFRVYQDFVDQVHAHGTDWIISHPLNDFGVLQTDYIYQLAGFRNTGFTKWVGEDLYGLATRLVYQDDSGSRIASLAGKYLFKSLATGWLSGIREAAIDARVEFLFSNPHITNELRDIAEAYATRGDAHAMAFLKDTTQGRLEEQLETARARNPGLGYQIGMSYQRHAKGYLQDNIGSRHSMIPVQSQIAL